ncbi:MAG TPA: methyltransferase domain-containing protein [Methyloceanibacter sp.]|nr:methyltransferase domain-containing protein [Methyloceanibacter sp.]
MSSILRMLSNRSAAVAQSFGARAACYEENADLQRTVAERLAHLLPQRASPRVLELGCGTGLFSRHLLARYPDGTFVFTDLAPSMLEQCRLNVNGLGKRVSFDVMDAARPTAEGPFDLIAMSMTLHWLADPEAALATLRKSLAPEGVLVFATLGRESFPEWRRVLHQQGLPVGLLDIPQLPGIVEEERLIVDADTLGFLCRMKAIGGLTPREGYAPLAAGALRRAIRAADATHGGRITWHIVYGRLAASQSSPSISPA